MAKRLGGSKRSHQEIELEPIDRLEIWQLPSMQAALPCVDKAIWFWKLKPHEAKYQYRKETQARAGGLPERLAQTVQDSDPLIEAAIALDPRLGRRPSWRRNDEGEYVDIPSWLANDDNPWFQRTRAGFTHSPAGGEPVRVVISTDDADIVPGTPAAFIATARLVMQFMPLEIWWQGAWLNKGKTAGYVFHVPLITNEIDFSRLEFCIADKHRDALSYCVMLAHAVGMGCRGWEAGRAEHSYMPGDDKFVRHDGISPDGDSVAVQAAYWLGWRNYHYVNYRAEQAGGAALQTLPPVPTVYPDETPAEKAKRLKEWEQIDQRREQQREADMKERMNKANAAE